MTMIREVSFVAFFLCLVAGCTTESTSATNPVPQDAAWSEPVNGLRARLYTKSDYVFNGTTVIATFIEFQNVSDVGNPMHIPWSHAHMTFRVTDVGGHDFPPAGSSLYSEARTAPEDLVLPVRGVLAFDISAHGSGVRRGLPALLNLRPPNLWEIEKDPKAYYLEGSVEIPASPDNHSGRPWSGRLILPRVQLLTPARHQD